MHARHDRSHQWAGRAISARRVPLCLESVAVVPLICWAAAGPVATVGVIAHVGAAIRHHAPAPQAALAASLGDGNGHNLAPIGTDTPGQQHSCEEG